MKAHLISSDEPLPSGGKLTVACGKEIQHAYFVFSLDMVFLGEQKLNALLCCQQCRTLVEPAKHYLYGVIEAQDVRTGNVETSEE